MRDKYASILFLLTAILFHPFILLGEQGHLKAAHRQGIPLPELLNIKPKGYLNRDALYQEYFAKLDGQILSSYLARWDYHERQTAWNLMQPKDKHFAEASLDNYRYQKEQPLRSDFAAQVLRLRLNNAIDTQLRKFSLREISTAHKNLKATLDKVQNVPIVFSKPTPSSSVVNEKSGELRIGYDVLNDHSKLEYVKSWVDIGLYYPRFLSSLLGSGEKFKLMNMAVTSNWSSTLPRATLSYPLGLGHCNASLSKPISTGLTAEILTSTPLLDSGTQHRGEMRLIINF